MFEFEDVESRFGGDPRQKLHALTRAGAARRGEDVERFSRLSWSTCTMCDCPCSVIAKVSTCHGAPIRIQGWK